MSYLRNGQRVFTAKDKAVRESRRQHCPDYTFQLYARADARFALTEKNINAAVAYYLRWYPTSMIVDGIAQLRADIRNRRFEMFATMQFLKDRQWREGVSLSGDPEDRRAWLYYAQAELKFALEVARRMNITIA